MGIESGMAENPGESYSLASRLVCAKCMCEPQIVNAGTITKGGGDMTVRVRCHGVEETHTFTRHQLVRTQYLFQEPEAPSDDEV